MDLVRVDTIIDEMMVISKENYNKLYFYSPLKGENDVNHTGFAQKVDKEEAFEELLVDSKIIKGQTFNGKIFK